MKQEDEQWLFPILFNCDELKMYDCKHCNFTSELLIVLKKHIQDYHNKEYSLNLEYTIQSYICKKCTFETYFSLNWLKHEVNGCFGNLTEQIESKLNDNNYCDDLNDSKSNISTLFFCEYCPFKTKRHHDLITHIKIRHETPEDHNSAWFVCKQCNYITRNEDDLMQHLQTNHTKRVKQEKYTCQDCSFTTQFKSWLKKHELKHLKITDNLKSFKCNMCPYKTHLKTVLERHTSLMHLPMYIVWLKCDLCEFQTKFKHSLNTHILNKHKDIKCFECDICAYKAKRNTTLAIHKLRKHTRSEDVNWYQCKLCPYKSKEIPHLKSHEITHMDVKDVEAFKCDHCSFVTKRKHTLTRHTRRKHLNEDDVPLQKCKLCPFVAKVKSDLKSHEFLAHSDERLKCDQCDFTSKWKVEIKCHKIRKHLRDDEIQWHHCQSCSYKGKFRRSLTKHMSAVHHKDKK